MPKGTKGIKLKDRDTTLAQRIVRRMKERYKISLPDAPVDEHGNTYVPTLPPDLTAISSAELGLLQGRFAAYADYVESCLATAEIDHLEGQNSEDIEEAKQRLRRTNDDGTVQDRKDDAFLDPAAQKVRSEALERKATRRFMQTRLSQLERDIKVLSREQSRREALHEGQ